MSSSSSTTCLRLHCYHGNHNCSSSAAEFSEFASSFLFSLGFSERLVNPRKTLDVNVLLGDLIRTSKISFSALSLGLLYMRRYARENPGNLQYSVYPVFVTALMAASKYLEDNTYTNKTWAILTGFKLFELNGLEMHFLQALRFRMHVAEGEYSEWLAQLLAFACQQQQPQLQLQLQVWNTSAEEEGAILAPGSTGTSATTTPTPRATPTPSSPAGGRISPVFNQGSQGVVKSQLIHLQTHHFGAAFRPQLLPSQVQEGSNTFKARRARSRSPSSSSSSSPHSRFLQQQQPSQLPSISSMMPSPAAISRKPLGNGSSPLRPYPELVAPLPTHLPRVAPVFRSTTTTLNDYFSQLQNISPSFLPPLQPKAQTLSSLWGSSPSLDDLLGKTTF